MEKLTPRKVLFELNITLRVPLSFSDPKSRKRDVVDRRSVFYRLCREFTDYSLTDLGLLFNQGHATVLNAENVVFPALEVYNTEVHEAYKLARNRLSQKAKTVTDDYFRQVYRDYLSKRSEMERARAKLNKLDIARLIKEIEIELN